MILKTDTATELPRARPAGEKTFWPIAFACGLAGVTFLPSFHQSLKAVIATWVAAIALALWNAALVELARRRRRTLTIEVVVKKQHWLQACAQLSVLVYWGWYWPQVYSFAAFILAQLLFAYAFDMLLGWSRRDNYTLSFAPFPVIFSINLFLWFRADWFYLQYLLVAVGMAAKEFIRWNRDGRRAHIFNPSSFPLAVFSLVLLATGRTDITWGLEIAHTQWFPPQIYLFLFLIGLPGQFFFGVTSMTMSAVVAACVFSRIYLGATGVYFFYASYIPISVFLGMHLLFNDPSTSPRTESGRIVFGTLYGLGTVAFYELLGRAGMPLFYDKLLPVPILNLSVKAIDRVARSRFLRRLDPAALGRSLVPRRRNLAYMAVWAVVFASLSAADVLGDNQPGQWLPFWRKACDDRRSFACTYLYNTEMNLCSFGSGWACNEAGLVSTRLSGSARFQPDRAGAMRPFSRGCQLGFEAACRNLSTASQASGDAAALVAAPPRIEDYPIILRGSKGDIRERDPAALYALACKQGWPDTCGRKAP